MRWKRKRTVASLGLLLLTGCHTLGALGEAFAALPDDKALAIVDAPLLDLEELLGMLLRLVGL